MPQFPLDTTSKIQTLLASAPDQIAERFFALENAHQSAMAAWSAKDNRLRALKEQRADTVSRRDRTVREIIRMNTGQVHVSADDDGNVTKKPNPMLTAIDNELALIDRKAEEAEKMPNPKSPFLAVEDFLHRLPAGVTLEAAELPTITLPPGKTYGDLYDAELAGLEADRTAGHDLWDVPPDEATVFSRIDRMIERRATPVLLGGLGRAHFPGDSINRRLADIPNPECQVPYVSLGRGVEEIISTDAFGMLCALVPDQIRESLRAQYSASFGDVETIAPAAKVKGVKALTAKIWQRHVKLEEIYLAATKAGFQLERLAKVDAAILLGCKQVRGMS